VFINIDYGRVDIEDQNENTQFDALNAAGCGKLYIEKCSGKLKDRPQLEHMLDALRKGDIVIVQ
jgi:DNA invertase Pin-like site-specific DNA recombinase